MQTKSRFAKVYAAASAWITSTILLAQDGFTLPEVSSIAAGLLGVGAVWFFGNATE